MKKNYSEKWALIAIIIAFLSVFVACDNPDNPDQQYICTHEFGSWAVTKQPTTTTDGTETRTCIKCGISDSRVIPATSTPRSVKLRNVETQPSDNKIGGEHDKT